MEKESWSFTGFIDIFANMEYGEVMDSFNTLFLGIKVKNDDVIDITR